MNVPASSQTAWLSLRSVIPSMSSDARLLLPLALCVLFLSGCQGPAGVPLAPVREKIASGPLRVSVKNPRYFTNDSGKAIYLVGSHTWSNFPQRGTLNPPTVKFPYDAYVQWMVAHNFNFMRMWTAELPYTGTEDDFENTVAPPFKWLRTGPGLANDGRPKFDLNSLDQTYFDRLRSRIVTARDNGIYVSVMLFEGEEWEHETNPHDGNPFEDSNNINGVDCPEKCPTDNLRITSAVWEYECAYIRKVVDTVNDLDNVLYEVSNEAGAPYSDTWQSSVIEFVHEYETSKPKQHPVGFTFQYMGGRDETLYASSAEWISPRDRFIFGDGRKVVINDTDHSYPFPDLKRDGKSGQRAWVWKNFTSGSNVAFMDPYLVKWPNRNSPGGSTADPHIGLTTDDYWDDLRSAMGATLTYANRMDLTAMSPQPSLSSTKYCLAHAGHEYLVYQPLGGSFALSIAAGSYQFEWLRPSDTKIVDSGIVSLSDGSHSFAPPVRGDAVLYLKIANATGAAR
jgi:hypothetical protein